MIYYRPWEAIILHYHTADVASCLFMEFIQIMNQWERFQSDWLALNVSSLSCSVFIWAHIFSFWRKWPRRNHTPAAINVSSADFMFHDNGWMFMRLNNYGQKDAGRMLSNCLDRLVQEGYHVPLEREAYWRHTPTQQQTNTVHAQLPMLS